MDTLSEHKPIDSQFASSMKMMGYISSEISKIYWQNDPRSKSEKESLGQRAKNIALGLAISERKSGRHTHEIVILSMLDKIMATYPKCFQKSEIETVKEMIIKAKDSFSSAKRQ